MQNRAIVAVGKHIGTNNTLTGRGVDVGVDEPMVCRVVVAALQIVEAGFGVVVIASVSQRVDSCEFAGCGNDFAIGVIIVSSDFVAGRID